METKKLLMRIETLENIITCIKSRGIKHGFPKSGPNRCMYLGEATAGMCPYAGPAYESCFDGEGERRVYRCGRAEER